MENIVSNEPAAGSYSIREFCARHGITTATYYKWRAAGDGPREWRQGGVVRISAAAEREWISSREDSSSEEATASAARLKARSAMALAAMRRAG